jgi:hypothetical protein
VQGRERLRLRGSLHARHRSRRAPLTRVRASAGRARAAVAVRRRAAPGGRGPGRRHTPLVSCMHRICWTLSALTSDDGAPDRDAAQDD